jgi:hypothetical protein
MVAPLDPEHRDIRRASKPFDRVGGFNAAGPTQMSTPLWVEISARDRVKPTPRSGLARPAQTADELVAATAHYRVARA